MKKITFLAGILVLIGGNISAQVGVNTASPNSTMDVSLKRGTGGTITDNTQVIGLQAPRLTRAELTANTAVYGTDQKGAQIYITDVSGGDTVGARANIMTTGYYSFDGTLWQKMQDTNIYTGDGTLTNNRIATLGGRSLTFTGSDEQTQWASQGYLYQKGLASSSSGGASIALISANKDGINGNTRIDIQTFADADGQILVSADTKKLVIGSNGTVASAPILFDTSSGGNALGTEKMRITGEGNVGINTSIPTEKLDNNGITRLRTLPLNGATNAINTTSGGTASSAQDQTFNATRTVVADANGVLGYVTGLPGTGGGTAPSGSISVGETISAVYSVPVATATVGSGGFRLGAYAAANGLTALPSLDGIQMDLLGYSSDYYTPIIINTASAAQLISYQTFATQVNENRTLLNQSLSPCPFAANTFTTNLWDGSNATGWRGVDANNIVYWNTANAEVETTNLQVQVDANTYRWYEFKWWCMEVSGNKKIFLSVTRKA